MKPEGPEDLYRLSPSQAGILFHSLLAPEADVYFRQTTGALHGPVDAAAFEEAWQRVVDRHTILRTSFLWEGLEKPVQVVHRRVRMPLDRHDWTELPPEEQQRRLAVFLAGDRAWGFDLTVPPLMRVALLRLSGDTHQLVWSYHHLILDGWSLPLLTREVFDVYEGLRRGSERVPAAALPYRRYIEWLQRQDLHRSEVFWRRNLAGFSAPTRLQVEEPIRRSGGEAPGFDESRAFLGSAGTAALQELGRRNGLTLNTLVQGAWALVLGAWSGENDVVFGTVSSGRPADLARSEEMIGVFISTLPVRVRLPSEEPLLSWLGRLQKHLLDLREHEHCLLVDVQGWSEVPRGKALFESLLVFENYPLGEAVEEDTSGMEIGGAEFRATTNYPLTLLVGPGIWISLKLVSDRSRCDRITALRLLESLRHVLASLPAATARRLSELAVLPEAEWHQTVCEWNDTRAPEPQAASVLELFERQAETSPGALAVIAGDERLTYRELRGRVERLAARLRALGAGPDAVVGVLLERSVEMVVALFAAMKAGGAYLPLDPESPPLRLAGILAESRPVAILTQPSLTGLLPAGLPEALILEPGEEILPAAGGDGGRGARPVPEGLAYVIYTSGSTGRPKGVMNHQKGLLNRIVWMQQAFRLGGRDRVLQKTPYTFDVSVWEFFWPLAYGACLVVAKPGGHRDPAYMAGLIEAEGITTVHFVPSMLQVFLEEPDLGTRCASLRHVIVSGEELSSEHRNCFLERMGCRLHNLYGPTEAAIDVTAWSSGSEGQEPVTIGRPIANTRIYLLDPDFRPVPAGVVGELCIGGVQPARGYLGRPDLTAGRFVPDPFALSHGAPGARLYRTGDLARFTADGQIEFLGRLDQQVKIRGFRIELGEIEATLLRHPGIAEAVVTAWGQGVDRRLIAHFVARSEAPAVRDLRDFLGGTLPDFMTPSGFVRVESLPRTSSGKVDRRSLPVPDALGPGSGEDVHRPRTLTEELLAGIFSSVLGVERLAVNGDFFESGGHSLLATQAVSRIRRSLGVDLPLAAIFGASTIARLAERVDEELRRGAGLVSPPIERVPRDGPLPVSFSQERLWLLNRLDPDRPDNLPFAVRLEGPLVPAALERALAEVVRRHEALRTRFAAVEEHPVQVIGPPWAPPLPLLDLADLSPEDRLREARALVRREGWRPFDLAEGPLLRAGLLRLAPEDHVILLAMHHIVADAWSLGVLTREVAALYDAFSRGEEPALAELPIQYADFAAWQRQWLAGEVLERHYAFWRRHLAGSDPFLRLPVEASARASREHSEGRRPLLLPRPLTESLRQLGRREGATLYMTLLAVFEVLLARYSGQLRFNVGSPVAGRGHLESEGLIGFFVNLLVLPADLSGDPSFRKLLQRVRDAALLAYAHQDLPYEKLLEALQPARRAGAGPLFQVMFALHNAPPGSGDRVAGGVRMGPFDVEGGEQRFDLHLEIELTDAPNGVGGFLRYRRGLFPEAWMDRMAAHFLGIVPQVLERPDAPISALELAVEEQPAVAIDFNDDLECA